MGSLVDIEEPDAQFPGLIPAGFNLALFAPDRLRIFCEEIRTVARSQRINLGPPDLCHGQPKIGRTVIAHHAIDRNVNITLLNKKKKKAKTQETQDDCRHYKPRGMFSYHC